MTANFQEYLQLHEVVLEGIQFCFLFQLPELKKNRKDSGQRKRKLVEDAISGKEKATEDLISWYEEQYYLKKSANRATTFLWDAVKAHEKVGFPNLELRNAWTTWNLVDWKYYNVQPDDLQAYCKKEFDLMDKWNH